MEPYEFMRIRTSILVILFALGILANGCETVKIPLARDHVYPADWPDITSAGPQCEEIAGSYYNEGVAVDDKGNSTPVMLARLLERNDPGKDLARRAEKVTLLFETRNLKKNGDSIGTLRVTMEGPFEDPEFRDYASDFTRREFLESCLCKKDFLHPAERRQSGGAAQGFGLLGGGTSLWLGKAPDGTLIARTKKYTVGFLVILPVYSDTFTWAIFRPVEEP